MLSRLTLVNISSHRISEYSNHVQWYSEPGTDGGMTGDRVIQESTYTSANM